MRPPNAKEIGMAKVEDPQKQPEIVVMSWVKTILGLWKPASKPWFLFEQIPWFLGTQTHCFFKKDFGVPSGKPTVCELENGP